MLPLPYPMSDTTMRGANDPEPAGHGNRQPSCRNPGGATPADLLVETTWDRGRPLAIAICVEQRDTVTDGDIQSAEAGGGFNGPIEKMLNLIGQP